MNLIRTFIIICVLLPLLSSAQEDKKIEVFAVGSGKTQDEARDNALLNAIEQAYGAFISSNIEVLNDEVIRNEIISISNGNIQDFNILSSIQIPGGEWSNTIKANVSIGKLISFCERKGFNIEFKGETFATNILQQLNNERNEIKVIESLCKVLHEGGEHVFDFRLNAGEPIKSNEESNWIVPLTIDVLINDNFYILQDYLLKTLKGISLSESEVMNYLKLNTKIYSVALGPILKNKTFVKPSILYFRSEHSLLKLCNFLVDLSLQSLDFKISNEIEDISVREMFEYNNKELQVIDDNFRPLIVSALYNSDRRVNRMRPSLLKLKKDDFRDGRFNGMVLRNNSVYLQQIDIWTKREIVPVYAQLVNHSLTQTNTNYYKGYFDMIISFLDIKRNSSTISIKYKDIRTIEELFKIKEYKVSPLGGP
jgi:hypothetical protein